MSIDNSTGNVISPLDYDKAEDIGRQFLSNRMIQAFSPVTFDARGYPIRIKDVRELWRYIDVMHETRIKQTITELLGGLTPAEFASFKRAALFVNNFTKRTFGKVFRCENALLRAMSIFRYLKGFNPRAVIEFGPGSGYLGLLHVLDGIGYIGVENSQAFYLLQNRLWSAAAGPSFNEMAFGSQNLRESLSDDLAGKAVHVPWWKVVDLDLASLSARVDAATANHCLSEMHMSALGYYLRLTHRLLASSKGVFAFEGWGDDLHQSKGVAARQFLGAGFFLAHADNKVTAFVPQSEKNETYRTFPFPISVKQRLENLARQVGGVEKNPYGYVVKPYSGDNAVSKTVRALEASVAGNATVGYDEVAAYLSDIYGSQNDSMEEKFLAMIGVDYHV